MKPLRALYWFRRRPVDRGGDLVALKATIKALAAFHVTGVISEDPETDLAPYDLIHLYNLCDPFSATDYVLRAARAQKPVVVTPIYWSHAQFDAAFQAGTPETRPEFFMGAHTEQAQEERRALRRRITGLLHDEQQLVLDAAGKILVLSNGEGEILQDEFGVPREKLQLTYYGVDRAYEQGSADRFAREFGLRDLVFCAARFDERKNQVGVIRAWRDEHIPLVLAGNATDPKYAALCQAEASENVHFVGTLTPAQIADADAAARVHVLASWWEEMGLSALEAGLTGCNLVMTQNGPGREYFGEDCVLCDPAEPASIRAAIRAALERPRATHLAKYIREKFTWEDSARATREAYDQVLTEKLAPTVDLDALMRVAMRMAEEFHALEAESGHATRELEGWALEMEARLKQPPSLRAALRGWAERLGRRQ